LTLVFAIVSGAITGYVLKLPIFEQVKSDEDLFEDYHFWEIPHDEEKIAKTPEEHPLNSI
jgi:hypothetical protein